MSHDELLAQRCFHCERLKDCHDKHEEKRDKFVEELAAGCQACGKGMAQKKIKEMRTQEQSRRDNGIINSQMKPTQRKGLTRVMGPSLEDPEA